MRPGGERRVIRSHPFYMRIEIQDHPELIEKVNETLSKGGAIELKTERSGIAAVIVKRELIAKEPYNPEKTEG